MKRKKPKTPHRFTPDVNCEITTAANIAGWSHQRTANHLLRLGIACLRENNAAMKDLFYEIVIAGKAKHIMDRAQEAIQRLKHDNPSHPGSKKPKPRKVITDVKGQKWNVRNPTNPTPEA